MMPIHSDLLKHWKNNQESEPIQKALRFLFLSNFGYMGATDTLRYGFVNDKNTFYKNIEKTVGLLENVQFMNCDFRKVYKSISFSDVEKQRAFTYLDPPYTATRDTYQDSFTEQDSIDLLDIACGVGIPFAMSEFDNPFILEQAEKRGLNIITIGERQNLKNRRTEILITNYVNRQPELF